MAERAETQPDSSPWAGDGPVAGPVLYETIIEPYRSMPRSAFRLLMIAFAALSLVPGTVLSLEGAWPCAGFLGLSIVLIYFAFRTSYAHARLYERIRLTRAVLGIERVWPSGLKQSWALEPYWARVEIENRGEDDWHMSIVSRGKRVTIGAFLPPRTLPALAEDLRAGLSRSSRLA